jgi:hypothetical protein
VIGSGIPMFDGPFRPQEFSPTGTHQLRSGVRILSFDRALSAQAPSAPKPVSARTRSSV